MSKPSVAQFISDKRAEGHDDSRIIHQLLDAGWHMDIIHKVMNTEIEHRKLEPILVKKQWKHRSEIKIAIVCVVLIIIALLAVFI